MKMTKTEELQRLLHRGGFYTKSDGNFGPATRKAVIKAQKHLGLEPDGIPGPLTLAALKSLPIDSKVLNDDALVSAATALGVNVATIVAITEVESESSGFLLSGKPRILFERHVFMRRAIIETDTQDWLDTAPGIINRKMGGYIGGESEHIRLDMAKVLDPDAALESASWGLFQIMGHHWDNLGYTSVQEFVGKMYESEAAQLDALVKFIKANGNLISALQARDWTKFARHYNGPAFAKNQYDKKMAAVYKRVA